MKSSRGFTLVEMLIVIIIISIVTTIALVGYKDYGAKLNVRRSANEVALAIREAQANALAVKGFDDDGDSGTPLLFTSWGINFTNASDNQLTMFVDSNGDQNYTNSTELVKTINISNKVKILDLRARTKTGISSDDIIGIANLNIIYQRPNPDTTLNADGGTCGQSGTCTDLEIILQGLDGTQRTVVVWSTGQISIE